MHYIYHVFFFFIFINLTNAGKELVLGQTLNYVCILVSNFLEVQVEFLVMQAWIWNLILQGF